MERNANIVQKLEVYHISSSLHLSLVFSFFPFIMISKHEPSLHINMKKYENANFRNDHQTDLVTAFQVIFIGLVVKTKISSSQDEQ
jgi:hypothetical protein